MIFDFYIVLHVCLPTGHTYIQGKIPKKNGREKSDLEG